MVSEHWEKVWNLCVPSTVIAARNIAGALLLERCRESIILNVDVVQGTLPASHSKRSFGTAVVIMWPVHLFWKAGKVLTVPPSQTDDIIIPWIMAKKFHRHTKIVIMK